MTFFTNHSCSRRSGVVIFLVLVLIPVMLGFGALTIDVGVLYNTRADLQNAADAGALAAADILGEDRSADGVSRARQAAIDVIQRHSSFNAGGPGLAKVSNDGLVAGSSGLRISQDDLVFGRIDFDADSNRYDFTPTEDFPDAVRVSVKKTAESANGPASLFFAGILGKKYANVEASATAGLTGARDIAVVIDLSGSMKYDSELRFYKDVPQVNMRDVWASLDGPPPTKSYVPVAENLSEYKNDTGPAFGIMNTWGNPITSSYNPTNDPGLWYIPDNAQCSIAAITTSLTARGYNSSRRDTIMKSSSSSTWPNRVAVMIGLAEWKPSSSSDTSIGNNELTWAPYPSFRKNWTWAEYIEWSKGTSNRLVDENSNFKFRFGVKTFVQFLLDRKYAFSETDFTKSPVEPMQSVKDGLQAMVDITRSFDKMSLEVFATTAKHERNLTDNRQAIADRLYVMQPNHYDNNTNIGAGLQLAINELTSSHTRNNARPMIVLMSDGVSNTGPNASQVAKNAVDLGIPVYTISVGAEADRNLLREIAEMTGGKEFFAEGTAAEYTAELRGIFRTIGSIGFATLVE